MKSCPTLFDGNHAHYDTVHTPAFGAGPTGFTSASPSAVPREQR